MADALHPVARFLDPHEQRYSLQHLMLAADRAFLPDHTLTARQRRRFGFLCGRCRAPHVARVFEIAAEMRCQPCGALMIVPAPRHGSPPEHANIGQLYCPQCGSGTAGDTTRQTPSFCDACTKWF